MYWNSFSDFVHMSGYGLYVWGSCGMVLAAMVVEAVLAKLRHRRALAQLGTQEAM